MKKNKTSTKFVCNSCGYESVQWYGKCPSCGEWNTLQEFKIPAFTKVSARQAKFKTEETRPLKLSEIKITSAGRISSGVGELDRVLGGGFITGEIVLLAGEPGVGKSTLLLQLADFKLFYVSGEESAEQIKHRAERLGIVGRNITVFPETQVEKIVEEISGSAVLIIDSVQTLWSENIEGAPGSISQVKGCTQMLVEFAKKTGIIILLVGQINKEGEIAGPMMLSHMVDCVLFLEGERFTELRLLRGLKNRFGPTDEVGVFQMTEKGMKEVDNPSEMFLGDVARLAEDGESRRGAITVCAMEGTRPMLLEIQALVTQTSLPIPRRVVLGLDYNRVMLLIAVLQKILHLPLYNQEIIVKVSGGFKISEPAADLGIALAIVSSFKDKPLNPKTCAFGEVGLLGEIRRVSGEEKRTKEAKKLGFSNILSSGTISNLKQATNQVK